ncbi:hydroxyisourate hydrolase [Roseomonas sp. OT10]|uniref:hydroxyisourate hydrolase n=1 Tax=Roseomonas cutis TaxID=2897332 RepID=UPI001E30116A|nr:hydroxyisourate hydrolase [Roseomonas sp. OT10]UFN47076.1 hydroxyisourate hydrolase [Roseomonas sp. OT10]
MKGPSLSTHVLDTADGVPAEGMLIELWRMEPGPERIASLWTNADGRTDAPLLTPETFVAGRYELRFGVGAYFAARGKDAGYFDVVALSVGLKADAGHYHVPLLCTPWSYSTYRGS